MFSKRKNKEISCQVKLLAQHEPKNKFRFENLMLEIT